MVGKEESAMGATQLRLRGLKLTTEKHKESVTAARFLAELLGNKQPTVTIEDVYRAGMAPSALGNAAGGVFESERWEMAGWRRTTRLEARGRWVMQWRLRASRS